MFLNHVGIVVKDIDKFINNNVCNNKSEIIIDKLQNNYLCFLGESKTKLELIQPLNEKSTVYNFLKKHGGGLHHICYEVENIKKANKIIKSKNMIKTYGPICSIAFNNRKVLFAFTRSGNLIEFLGGDYDENSNT